MDRLAGKVAVVIGAGQNPGEAIGNGRATVVRFLQEGASVLAVDRNAESARETIGMVEDVDAEVFAADVRRGHSLGEAIDAALARWGRIDILHYNVGVNELGGDQQLDSITEDVFDDINAINLRGAIMAAKHVEPVMRAQRSGVVLNLASVDAVATNNELVAYRSSKAGLIAFTQLFAARNAGYGVRANAILPGRIDTATAVDARARRLGVSRDELAAQRADLVPLKGHVGTGWDVANAAVFLASDEAGFITGVSLPVDGGALVKIGW